jgi:hypothetical protein
MLSKEELSQESPIRKLARTPNWMTIYSKAKEIGSIKLFNNDTDFSQLQIDFLRYLELMYNLYTDLALQEEFLIEEVIIDPIRADAYLLYKSKKREEEKSKMNKTTDVRAMDSIVFVSGKKRSNLSKGSK